MSEVIGFTLLVILSGLVVAWLGVIFVSILLDIIRGR